MNSDRMISEKFWFKIRKGIFQVLLPSILGFYTLFGYAQNSETGTYSHLYFYTALILLTQTIFRHISEYIFDICSVSVIIKNSDTRPSNVQILNIVRVFKTKYSSMKYLEKTVQVCNFLGIDSPIFIPYQVVEAFTMETDNKTDEEIITSTIDMIDNHKPVIYQAVNLGLIDDQAPPHVHSMDRAPQRIITSLDASIKDLRFEIFGEHNARSEIETSIIDQF
jgi:hypothetical protein